MDSMPIEVFSPIRMMDPLPNCLSMAANATSSAFSRSLFTVGLRFLPDACGLAEVEAGLHDLDCVDGHHTEGVLHSSVSRFSNNSSVTTNSRSIKYYCDAATTAAASVISVALGRWTARSNDSQMVKVNG